MPPLVFVLLVLPALCAHAQNAAQQQALAKLAQRHGRAFRSAAADSTVQGTSTGLSKPGGLAFDTLGNLFIADTDDNMVLKIDLTGNIGVVAGTGDEGFGGDGGPAISAQLDSPTGVAVDSAGNLYIGDTHNNRVRKVEAASGNISTIAGNGAPGYAGDGGAATAASLNRPTAVAVDASGNVYIADTNNHRIREIAGAIINTVAGNGVQGFSGDNGLATAAMLDSPLGAAVDAAFNLYIGDTHNQRVRVVSSATGIIATIAGNGTAGFAGDGGAATSGSLDTPTAVAVDSNGNVFVADSDNQRIRMIGGGNLSTAVGDGNQGYSAQSGAPASMALDTPRAVAASANSVVLADTQNDRVVEASGGGTGTVAGQPPASVESLAIGGAPWILYGTGTLTATLSNAPSTATGQVSFYDGFSVAAPLLGSANLAANTASIATGAVAAGTHSVVASYAGDAKNAPATSGVYVLVVTPAPLTAIANAISLLYGQPPPPLTGRLNSVLAQDAGNVTAVFTTIATAASSPGIYPIAASLSGPSAGNYTVALGSGSGSVTIAKAPVSIGLTSTNQSPVRNGSITLTATVASTTSGAPTGTVNFYDGAALLNATPAAIVTGAATVSLNVLGVGAHSITAVYSGDADFLGATSNSVAESVLSPEFTLAASPATQTVLPLHSVAYSVSLTPVNATFVYPVSLSVSGLPSGVTASFSPASIMAGSGAATSTLTLSAGGTAQLRNRAPLGRAFVPTSLALLILPLAFVRRARRAIRRLDRAGRIAVALLALACFGALAGCGDGGFYSHQDRTSTVTIAAVGGPVTQTTTIALTVQ